MLNYVHCISFVLFSFCVYVLHVLFVLEKFVCAYMYNFILFHFISCKKVVPQVNCFQKVLSLSGLLDHASFS